jgi:hypothetical protein
MNSKLIFQKETAPREEEPSQLAGMRIAADEAGQSGGNITRPGRAVKGALNPKLQPAGRGKRRARIKIGRAWRILFIPHNDNGSQETVEEFPDCPCTGIWVTDTGLEFTAQYDTGPYNPYAPDHNTTEMWPVSPVEPDWKIWTRWPLWKRRPPPFLQLKYMKSAPFTVWWRMHR